MIGELLLVTGAALIFLASVGMLRFSDVFVRMQVLSKASTFGLLAVLIGGVVELSVPNDITTIILAGALHLVTSPIGSNLLARATYFAEGIGHGIDTVDELAELPSVRRSASDGSPVRPLLD